MIIALVPTSGIEVEAASPTSVGVAGEENVLPESTVTVDISIKDNPGILGAILKLEYDSKLTLKAIKAGDAFSSLTLTKPGILVSGCKFVWDGQELSQDDIKDGVILSLTFNVSETAEAGDELPISVSFEDAMDKDLNAVEIAVTNGKICIQEEEPPGVLSYITAEKTLITYEVGDVLNIDDIKVTAVYSDGTNKEITKFKTNVELINMQEKGEKELVVYYDENDIIVTSVILIQVLLREHNVHIKDVGTRVEPTCEEKGSVTYKCTMCGKVIEVVELATLCHTWDEGKITKEPTEMEEGVKTYTCKRCGRTRSELIPRKEVAAPQPLKKGDKVTDDKKTGSYEVIDVNKKEVAYQALKNKKAKTITVPNTIKLDGATYKVTNIADNAFKSNKTITKIIIGNDVKTIGKNAFSGSTKLKTVIIGKNVIEIGANAFSGCKNLKTITIKSSKLTSKSVGKNAFKGTNKKLTIKVPKKKVSSYKKFLGKKGNSKVKVKKG